MRTSRITPVWKVGSLVAVATLAVVGVAGCGGDNRTQADPVQQASGRQADNGAQTKENRVAGTQGAAKAESAYCSAVGNFNGALSSVPAGKPSEVQDSLDKVSAEVGRIVRAAPEDVRKDWSKLHDGFDQLNKSYNLLDGIDETALSKLQSASTKEEVDSVGLRPADAKKYQRFQQKASGISEDVEKSGKKVSKQVQKKCGISIGQ